MKIGFSGPPAAGKTINAMSLAHWYKTKTDKQCHLINEYARTFIENYGKATPADQYFILQQQIKMEKEIDPNHVIITDSPVFLNYVYATLASDGSKKDEMYVSRIHEIAYSHKYDIVFNINHMDQSGFTDPARAIWFDKINTISRRITSAINIWGIRCVEFNFRPNLSHILKHMEISPHVKKLQTM